MILLDRLNLREPGNPGNAFSSITHACFRSLPNMISTPEKSSPINFVVATAVREALLIICCGTFLRKGEVLPFPPCDIFVVIASGLFVLG